MALEQSGNAPYAPVRAIALVIDQFRDRAIPTPITTKSLDRLGIEPSLTQRTLAALKQLDLLEETGEPSPTLRKIETAPTDQLQTVLADWVREAYKPILSFVDPSDDVQRISDQFRHYDPKGQRNRMVTLFLGLCAKAGLIDQVPALPRTRQENGQTTTKKTQVKRSEQTPTGKPQTQNGARGQVEPPDARQRYLDLLIAKAAEQDVPDAGLLDRIERALGIAPAEGSSST